MTTLYLGSDHGGFALKNSLKSYLVSKGFTIIDEGTHNEDSCDYPDLGKKVAQSVLNTSESLGILICGTGIGISIAANRFKGIRAALVYNDFTAQMAKEHNNANILCLGARTTDEAAAKRLIDIWLNAKFEGGRHQNRVNKLG